MTSHLRCVFLFTHIGLHCVTSVHSSFSSPFPKRNESDVVKRATRDPFGLPVRLNAELLRGTDPVDETVGFRRSAVHARKRRRRPRESKNTKSPMWSWCVEVGNEWFQHDRYTLLHCPVVLLKSKSDHMSLGATFYMRRSSHLVATDYKKVWKCRRRAFECLFGEVIKAGAQQTYVFSQAPTWRKAG